MSRRLKNDPLNGLGWCMGDKATDLFVKWAVGTFRLGNGLSTPWTAEDCPLPMDQRVGRVLMRSGFMDEFFGVARVMSAKNQGFSPPPDSSHKLRPSANGEIPEGRWHLMVKDFRRNSRVQNPRVVSWLQQSLANSSFPAPSAWRPQDVLSAMCRSYNLTHGNFVTPVELDDFLMRVAETCTDDDPKCSSCVLSNSCQANQDSNMVNLKRYIT